MTGPQEFGAGYWEHRYRSGRHGGGAAPSPSLLDEAGALPPGRALDAGCGRGADALWLAARGWQVTAVDVSASALDAALLALRAAGEDVAARVELVHADLTTWDPGDVRFDLVTCSYVHVPGPAEELYRRLASWVAPGGTLLVVGHDAAALADGHGHPPHSRTSTGQVTAGLPGALWEVLVIEARTHTVHRPDGPTRLHDVVVRARRLTGAASGADVR